MVSDQENREGRKFQFLRHGQGFLQKKYGRVIPPGGKKSAKIMASGQLTSAEPESRPPTDSGCQDLEQGSPPSNRTMSSTMMQDDNTALFEHHERQLSADSTPLQTSVRVRPGVRDMDVRMAGGVSGGRSSLESDDLGSLHSSNWNERATTSSPSAQPSPQQQQPDNFASSNSQGDGGRSAPTIASAFPPPFGARPTASQPAFFDPYLPFCRPRFPFADLALLQQRPVHPFAGGVQSNEERPSLQINAQLHAAIEELNEDQRTLANARASLERQKKQLADEQAKSRLELETLRKEWEEQQEAELEKLRRATAGLNKQKKLVEKDESEKIKLLKEEIVSLQETVSERDRQISEHRSEGRELKTKLAEMTKTLAQCQQDKERLVRRNLQLENSAAKLREQAAKQAMRLQADASIARRSQSSGTPDDSLRRALKENVAPRSAPPHPNAKSVRFQLPDDSAGSVFPDGSGTSSPALMSTPAMPSRRFGSQLQQLDNMQVMSPLNGMTVMDTQTTISGGVCTKYADASSWTKYTLEADRCNNYVYSNGDIKWIDSSKLLEVDWFANGGMTEAVLKGSTTIRHFLTGQLDIYHADGGISNYKPDGTRVEFHSSSRTVEHFLRDGSAWVRRDGETENSRQEVTGSRPSYRDDGSYVETRADGSTELFASSFILRRWPDGNVKVKFPQLDVALTMTVQGPGEIKHVFAQGNEKRSCCTWGQVR